MESCDEETAALRERGSRLLLCIGCRPSANVSRYDSDDKRCNSHRHGKVMAAMTDLATLLIAVCAIAFGCCFVRVGKDALLSQNQFLQFCRGKQTEELETEAFDLSSSGEPINLRLLGVGLLAVGLFIVISVASLLLIRIGNLT